MYYKPIAGFCQFAPLDKPGRMDIIVSVRGRCDKRSAPQQLNDYFELFSSQKPSPCRVAVFCQMAAGGRGHPPLRGNGFPRQCEHWLGMTARQRRADGASYPKGICSAALHCRTPSPTN